MNNLPATPENLLAGLQNVANTSRQAAGPIDGVQFMKYSKGEWTFGADGLEAEEGSEWAVNPMSISQGFVAWVDGDLAGEEMATMFEPPIIKSSLPEVDTTGLNNNGWQSVIAFSLVCLTGEDEGVQCELKLGSKGGVKEGSKLINSILAQVGKDATKPVPVVTLGGDSYKHKKYGKIHTPEMRILKWIAQDGEAAAPAEIEEEPELIEEEAPKKRRRARK